MQKINLLPLFSCIGVVVTGYLAYRNADKIKSTLYCAKEEEFKDKETNIDLLKAAAPPLIAGAATCACVIVHGRATAKQIASLGAGCAFLYKKYKTYREKVRDICGEEVDRKIIAEIAKDDWQVYPAIPCFDDEQKMLFYDAFSERFFYATYDRVQQALYHINRNLQLRGDTTINEFYDFIGIEPVFYGEKTGWDQSYFIEALDLVPWIDPIFREYETGDGEPYIVIDFAFGPESEEKREEMIEQ